MTVAKSDLLAALGADATVLLAEQAADASRPALADLAEVLKGVPDPVTRYLAAALIARLTELASA